MKKTKKIGLIISLSLVITGLIISFISFALVGFDLAKMSTVSFEMYTYNIDKNFDKINIYELNDNIEFILSEDESCKIICYDNEKIYHECFVDENDELKVLYKDESEWYEKIRFFFFKENNKIKIYLPKNKYDTVSIYSVNGNIDISEVFNLDTATLTTINGGINCSAVINEKLNAESTNGNIDIKGNVNGNIHLYTLNGRIAVPNINKAEKAYFGTTNGSININGNRIESLQTESVNGDINVSVKVKEKATFETVNGDITFENFEAEKIKAKTVNGSITGTILSDKSFEASSVNGSVNVPNLVDENGDFVLKTTNGKINIKKQLTDNTP